jgi:hypothetical protein
LSFRATDLLPGAVAVALAALSQAALGQGKLEEITIVDGPIRFAFYEAAPRAIARSMQNAVSERCTVLGLGKSSAASVRTTPWFCAGEVLQFFRAVSQTGDRTRTGVACRKGAVMPNLKYYPDDTFTKYDVQCVVLSYDERSRRHTIDDWRYPIEDP